MSSKLCICEKCAATFPRRHGKASRFCTVACYRAHVAAQPRVCEHCSGLIPQTSWSFEAKFCSRSCYAASRSGANGHHWLGGRSTDDDGYVRIWMPDNEMARRDGYVLEHRLVMAEAIGRPLDPQEVVHHINGIRDDNRIENLILFNSQLEHMRHHALHPALTP